MNKISKQSQDEIDHLKNLPDSDIDTSDIPGITDWSNAEIGKFYRPRKKQVTLRLDADMLEWFRKHGNKYQTRINQILRHYMDEHQKAS
ncbi:MAG: BrnA antitoxin family protein [gamma proteobacterium symbiont of Taylorina sp.]|nr:BrnA antitoxin family protein [gamma proteobacterium symbiont of Taylorina sp.]